MVRVVVLSMLVLLAVSASALAGRLYGNINLSYERLDQQLPASNTSDYTRESAVLNYEDLLFYKNSFRLTANLQRREFAHADYHEFQPIYIADIASYGYQMTVRYSPYTRRSLRPGTDETFDVHYRDWRFTTQLNYDKLPTFSFIFNRLRNWDDEDVPRFDAYNRSMIFEGSYTLDPIALRANYNNLRQVNNILSSRDVITKTYSATAAGTRSFNGTGYVSTTYNYYDTKRSATEPASQESHTHSLSALGLFTAIPKVSINVNYSGRFSSGSRNSFDFENSTQNMSGSISYAPFDYLTIDAVKGYQASDELTQLDIVEYLSAGATVTRYMRKGIDTRLTYNRTMFQQSARVRTIQNQVGSFSSVDAGDYALDTYHAALRFEPRQYVRTFVDITLTRDTDPVDSNRRYQLTRSIDTRLRLSRRLEGRVTITSLYQGEKLALNRSYSQNYNTGLTFVPQSNINVNLTYIHSTYNTQFRTTRSSFTGYISYAFRRAFTVYLSINEQTRRQEPLPGVESPLEISEVHPRNINSQLMIYVSSRTTLTLAYVRSDSESALADRIKSESFQGVLNIQI